MNRGKTQTSFFLVTLFFILPLLQFASAEIETQDPQMDRVYGDPNDADLSFAHPYVIPDTDSQIYSGTAHMVQAWIDAGSPSNQAKNAKSSALYKLVNFVKNDILNKYNVSLEEEIIFVGDFD